MLDTYIKERVDLVSYNNAELANISTTLSYLKSIINNQPDFKAPFLGGSYKRKTMVKGVSDVDVYFEYTGNGNAQSALTTLKNCLIASYPNSIVKQDKPSILVEFNKIPINITPYKKNLWNQHSIPDRYLSNWVLINMEELEVGVQNLRNKNLSYIDLIKILKLWNFNHNRGLKNFDIEKRVCNFYGYGYRVPEGLSDLVWSFFHNNGFNIDAQRLFSLKLQNTNRTLSKGDWLKFINNG